MFRTHSDDSSRTAAPPSRQHTSMRALAVRLVIVALALMACGPGGQTGTVHASVPVPTVNLDTSLKPYVSKLPSINGEGPRTVAAMTDASGIQADFVENEIIVNTSDGAALAALVKRWNGTILATTVMKSGGLANVPDQALVRIDASKANAAQLAADLHIVAPDRSGNLRISSQAGLLTLAAAEHESATQHILVIPNFLAQFDNEAPAGDALGAIPYNRDPSTWPYMSRGGPQDIGVAPAWTALVNAGRGANRVRVAILDAGFSLTNDLPAGTVLIPGSANNVPNPWPTDTGGSDRWHGTQTADTAAGIVGNGFGAAGTGGPVAQTILVQSPGPDFFEIINYLVRVLPTLASMRPQIVNMSFSVRIPAPLNGAFQLVSDPITRTLHNSGIVIVAAAGNNGQNVDAQDCFVVCWNKAFWAPCQNAGVLCVGGLNINATTRSSSSNYGSSSALSGTVSMYAPYDVLTGPDPDVGDTNNRAFLHSGTSFSSPFVAGVAALVWAANPALTADQVQQFLYTTAHTGSHDSTVPRWINALAAVNASLQTNTTPAPPSCSIASPANGSHFPAGSTVTFVSASEQFPADHPVPAGQISWSQTLSGGGSQRLPSGTTTTHVYGSVGTYTVTVTCTADNGLRASAHITIVIDPASPSVPPSVTIVAPTQTDFYITSGQTVPVTFSVTGTSGLTFTWSDSVQGNLGSGASITANMTDPSSDSVCDTDHVVTVTARDSAGHAVATASITIHVHHCIA